MNMDLVQVAGMLQHLAEQMNVDLPELKADPIALEQIKYASFSIYKALQELKTASPQIVGAYVGAFGEGDERTKRMMRLLIGD